MHVELLQQTLLRDDQSIKNVRNQDARDVARQASVTASAEKDKAKAELVVDGFTRDQLRQNKGTLLTASGLVSTVSDLGDVPGAPHVTPTGNDVRAAYAVAPPDIQRSIVSPQGDAANIIFRTGPSSLDARAKVVREVRKTVVSVPGIRATPSGLAVVGVAMVVLLGAGSIAVPLIVK